MTKEKLKKISFYVPENVYKKYESAALAKSRATVAAGKGLTKMSEMLREGLIKGLVTMKELNVEAEKRVKKK